MFLRPSDRTSPLAMPVSQFDQAFALLEQSFRDANFLQAYKTLPSRQATEKADSPKHSDFSDDDDDESDSDASMHEGYRLKDAPAISLMRSNSTLPPTPPTRSRDASATYAHLVPLPEEKPKPGIATPPNQQRPPTPDLTPPTTRNKNLAPPRPAMPHSCSSRAESFITARETQSQASAHTSQSSLPLRSEAGNKWLNATRSVRLGSLQLGLADRQRQSQESVTESGGTTPTQETEGGFPAPPSVSANLVEYIGPEHLDREQSSTPESVESNFMRNVTIRKKRGGHLHQQTTSNQQTPTSNQKRDKPAPMPLSEGSNESPSTIKDGETLDWPEIANDHLYRHIRDEKSKRLSNASNTSTVIEAFVLAAPARQQKLPALRRVSGVDTLRDNTSSKRSSIDSTSAYQQRLKHRVAPLPGRKHMVDERNGTRSASNPETGDKQNRLYRPKNHSSLVRGYHGSEPSDLTGDEDTTDHVRSWLDKTSANGVHQQPRTRLRHVSAPIQTHGSSNSAGDTFRRFNGNDARLTLSSQQGWKRHSLDADLESPEQEHPRRLSTDRKHLVSPKQTDPSTQALFEYPFQPPRKSSESREIRHLHSNTTPVSLLSDRTDSMELNEAKAVNLFSHENKSLLMVQHVARRRLAESESQPASSARRRSEPMVSEREIHDEDDDGHAVFRATLEMPTLPSFSDAERTEVDSPLRNPRQAPLPPQLPSITVSPATPHPPSPSQSEEEETTPPQPIRRPSLVEKARRYSENLIQPFLTRQTSHRSRRSTASSARPTSAEDRNTTLHPFWRPRGFWDDFSDSEEEYAYSDDGYGYEDEPLPAGGDTSDVCSLESLEPQSRGWMAKRLSVRLPGFRGQGGFMLGNSLGIDRHGTNIRRPYIAPAPAPVSSSNTQQTTLLRRVLAFPSLRKRKSTDLLRQAAQSTESLRRLAQRHKKRRFKWGVGALRRKVAERKEGREEAERQRIREEMKRRIGSPVYVET